MIKKICNVLIIFLCLVAVKNVVYGFKVGFGESDDEERAEKSNKYTAMTTYWNTKTVDEIESKEDIEYYVKGDIMYNDAKKLEQLADSNTYANTLTEWANTVDMGNERFILNKIRSASTSSQEYIRSKSELSNSMNKELVELENYLFTTRIAKYRRYNRAYRFLPTDGYISVDEDESIYNIEQIYLFLASAYNNGKENLVWNVKEDNPTLWETWQDAVTRYLRDGEADFGDFRGGIDFWLKKLKVFFEAPTVDSLKLLAQKVSQAYDPIYIVALQIKQSTYRNVNDKSHKHKIGSLGGVAILDVDYSNLYNNKGKINSTLKVAAMYIYSGSFCYEEAIEEEDVFYSQAGVLKEHKNMDVTVSFCDDNYDLEDWEEDITLDEYNTAVSSGLIYDNNKLKASKFYGWTLETEETTGNGGGDSPNEDWSSGVITTYDQCLDGWWACAFNFLSRGSVSDTSFGIGSGAGSALSDIKNMLSSVGNIIFLLVTAYLGVKYIWGGVDSKYSVKNSLMTLVVAAIVFYGWGAVTDILDVKDLLTGQSAASGVESMTYKIYNTVMYIINVAAVAGIIYIGIRYMVAGAEGKSELKLKAIPVIMGIIMVYGTINLINFILDIVYGVNANI